MNLYIHGTRLSIRHLHASKDLVLGAPSQNQNEYLLTPGAVEKFDKGIDMLKLVELSFFRLESNWTLLVPSSVARNFDREFNLENSKLKSNQRWCES